MQEVFSFSWVEANFYKVAPIVTARRISSVLKPTAIGCCTPGKTTTSYNSSTIPSIKIALKS
jgi:hypothetical protein